MKKFKKGDRVIPISKTVWGDLYSSESWNQAQAIKQPFLFVQGFDKEEDAYCCWVNIEDPDQGDFYAESDLVLYEELVVVNRRRYDTWDLDISKYNVSPEVFCTLKVGQLVQTKSYSSLFSIEKIETDTVYVRNMSSGTSWVCAKSEIVTDTVLIRWLREYFKSEVRFLNQ